MRILAGHHGLRGDLAINLPAIRHLHKNAGFTIDMPIHQQFADMLPLFANHPALNACVITDDYEHFPSDKDRAMLATREYANVFNPMARHRDDAWHQRMHQTSCVLFDYIGRELPVEEQQIELTKWFTSPWSLAGFVAFAPFAGNYSPGNPKALSVQTAQTIVDRLVAEGHLVMQVGGPGEPELVGAQRFGGNYFDSVRQVLGCKGLIHTDTGMGWVISGYKHPQLGLYSHEYYGVDKVTNIQPRNPNGLYLSAENVNQISVELIVQSLTALLS